MRAGVIAVWIVGLTALVASALHWGPDRVERDLEARSRAALEAASVPLIGQLSIAAEGRRVRVSGSVADASARDAVLQALRGVRGVAHVDEALLVARPATATAAVPTTAAASTTLGLGSLRAQVAGGKVRLQGSIPDQAVRVALVQRLLRRFGPLLADELQLGGDADPALVGPFGRFLEQAALSMSDGSFVLSEQTLVLSGTTVDGAAPAQLVSLARRTSPAWTVVNAFRPAASAPEPTVPVVPGGPGSAPTTTPGGRADPGAPPATTVPPSVDWQRRVDELLTNAPVPLDPGAARLPAVAGLVLEQVARLVVAADPAAVEVVVREPALPVPADAAAQADTNRAAAQATSRTQKQADLVTRGLRDRGLLDVPMTGTGAGAVAPPPGAPDLAVRVVLRYPPPPTTAPTTTTVVGRRRSGSASSGSSSRSTRAARRTTRTAVTGR